ncbi:chloride channel protein [Bradyrhizobium sp. Ai1a-2]|uniref:chloride channel protein n=1 Tax=Bradyrhizobium sp. Ai1a-2 TaxID=196490 RepID=UPI0004223834|nr:chloride channel protein [Bradyrhizobium sp. Ai1a-2]
MHHLRSAGSRPRLGDFTTDPRVLVLVAMAAVVGAGGVAGAWVLLNAIALVTNLVWFQTISTHASSLAEVKPDWWMVAAPVLGGVVIGLMARFGSEKIRGHGIPEAIEAILIGESRMSPKVAVLKPLSSAVSIGTGGPFGAEGPIIMTGGAIGSLFAQCFSLSAAERKTLLVAGATAGMTAIFGTPVAAVLLAVELLLFEWKPRSLIPVITACAVSIALRPYLLGSGPLFPLSGTLAVSGWGLVVCAGVGIVAGLQSGLLTGLLYKFEDFFGALPIHWMWWPALGGLAVGLGGLIEPRALAVGYDVIGDLLASHVTARQVALILIVKSIIWIVALASGTSGGVLAPLLIFGGCLGWLEGQYLPGDTGAWALIGMAAMMGGTMRSPLTAALFAVELTGDFALLVPLLIATGAAYAVTVLMLKRSILTEKIARRGQHIVREYGIDPFELLRVGEVMVREVETLPADMGMEEAINFFSTDDPRHKSYPILTTDRRVVGMVSRGDILRWRLEEPTNNDTLGDRLSDDAPIVGYADEPVSRLADRMATEGVGRVPIVEFGTMQLVGLVSRKDLLHIRRTSRLAEEARVAYFGTRRPALPKAAQMAAGQQG